MKPDAEVSPCCGWPIIVARAYQGGEQETWCECMCCGQPVDPITRAQYQQILLQRRTTKGTPL